MSDLQGKAEAGVYSTHSQCIRAAILVGNFEFIVPKVGLYRLSLRHTIMPLVM